MSTRRAPLSSNPNAANSPLRTRPAASLAAFLDKVADKVDKLDKQALLDKHRQQISKRAHASVQREEAYAQPPPAKKQLLNDGSKEAVRSPPAVRQVKITRKDPTRSHKDAARPAHSTAVSKAAAQQEEEAIRMRRWKDATRENFPAYVFYFESVPDDKRAKVVKQIMQLGGREEKFFSKDITHVITTRPLPSERPNRSQSENVALSAQNHRLQQQPDMPRTIDPSLLSRDPNVKDVKDVRRRLLESGRKRVPAQTAEGTNAPRQPPTVRNTDILVRAHEMKKKIWQLSKIQHILHVMLDPDPLATHGNDPKGSVKAEQTSLAQLLNKERVNGPSDRDPAVSLKELIKFNGPYLYIHDIEEKHKPIMVREYARVMDKHDGDWPQFRVAKEGRCPFVEEVSSERQRREDKAAQEKERERRRQRALAQQAVPELNAPPPPPPLGKPIGKPAKRSLADMQDTNDRASGRGPANFDLAKATNPPSLDFNAFASRAKPGRLFGGEPVASGLQRSNVTSGIRSQMISSATGVLGGKAGTSKEVHGLQRKVLHKGALTSANPTSQDTSSRRLADMSLDTGAGTGTGTGTFQRSASLGLGARKLGQIAEDRVKDHKRTVSVPSAVPAKAKKRELKPGYCENCQDKFEDFDEHVLVKKHRKFAEDPRNWTHLDELLSLLERVPRYKDVDDDGSVGSPGY